MIRISLKVRGIVQGVGFRPYVFKLAKSLSLNGFVQNTSEGVYAEIEGDRPHCEIFIRKLHKNPPVLARIDDLKTFELPVFGYTEFVVAASKKGTRGALISPDVCICDACLSDISNMDNRRYRYAFTNCTDCGPRFTIISDIPYDRVNTTMAEFTQCPECQAEYNDPGNRRFHAQPNACPVCGPELSFYKAGKRVEGDPYELFDECIGKGGIVALKGIGGYHLTCDAGNSEAVDTLRKRKLRYDKPFALMVRDIDTARQYCEVSLKEEQLLKSSARPIVLLTKRPDLALADGVAPGNSSLGIMLPYTPLHSILMEHRNALVMTSANTSDLPMIFNDSDIFELSVPDAVLTHNRGIYRRVDDSVCVVLAGKARMIRRARGYVPQPISIGGGKGTVLALGAQQKNTFCLTKGGKAFISGHIGDLNNFDTEQSYDAEINSFIRMIKADPVAVACDLHPDYASTRYAERFRGSVPIIGVQHHHAHIASVLAEHNINEEAAGIVFDGSGFGTDGTIWGGEALYGGVASYERVGHLLHMPLFGGEAAIREPWRVALAVMEIACGESSGTEHFGGVSETLVRAGKRGINSPLTSSMGRLFDAVSAIAGIRTHTSYEGQAAIELEALIDTSERGRYGFDLVPQSGMLVFDWRQLIRDVVNDVHSGVSHGAISMKFHRAVAYLICGIAGHVKKLSGSRICALSGGVFQNAFVLNEGSAMLERQGFEVISNEKVPANDGGISYGQAAVALRKNLF